MLTILNLILAVVLLLTRYFSELVKYIMMTVSIIFIMITLYLGVQFYEWLHPSYFAAFAFHFVVILFKAYKYGKQSAK